jgi:hypothetical protein
MNFENLTEKELNTLKSMTILKLAQNLEYLLTNDLIHEDTSVLDFIKEFIY